MPRDTTSPFTPGRPVPVEFFAGRQDEIERLRRKVREAVSAKRIEVAFVAGERGIGKSSLVSFVRHLCERDFSTLGIHAFMGGVDTVEGAVRRVFDQLLKESAEGSLFDAIKGLFGKHIREVGLFGISVEFDPSHRELATLTGSFAGALRNLLASVRDKRQGILLVMDDINGLAGSLAFANWLKSLVDEISTTSQPLPLCLILVGLDERRRSLIEHQPSLARVFDPVVVRAWSEDETSGFLEESFRKVGMRCEPSAAKLMTRYAGGLPVLAHEIGDATFSADRDGVIDEHDALDGVVAAADVVGRRYLDPVVYRSIRSQRYRTILRRLARESSRRSFRRSEVRESLPDDERRVFDNFLAKMKKLGVVEEDPEKGSGAYQFSTLLHYLYFAMEAGRAESKSA